MDPGFENMEGIGVAIASAFLSLPDDTLNKDGGHCLVSMSSNPCTNGCMRLEVGLHMGRETIWHTSEVHTITAI